MKTLRNIILVLAVGSVSMWGACNPSKVRKVVDGPVCIPFINCQ